MLQGNLCATVYKSVRSQRKAKRVTPEYLSIGRVIAPWGRHGEVNVQIETDFPERFTRLGTVYLGDPPAPIRLERARPHKGRMIVKVAGCDDRQAAESLRGQHLYVPSSEAMPLGEDEYYVWQIEGLEVWTTEGKFLGTITEVLFTGSNEVYIAQDDTGREVLIPAIADVVQEVDVEGGRLILQLMEGLI